MTLLKLEKVSSIGNGVHFRKVAAYNLIKTNTLSQVFSCEICQRFLY